MQHTSKQALPTDSVLVQRQVAIDKAVCDVSAGETCAPCSKGCQGLRVEAGDLCCTTETPLVLPVQGPGQRSAVTFVVRVAT